MLLRSLQVVRPIGSGGTVGALPRLAKSEPTKKNKPTPNTNLRILPLLGLISTRDQQSLRTFV